MIDEALNTFRADIAGPDRQTAERVFALATREVRNRRPLLRRRLALGVAVAALILVPAGVAFGGKLADLFEGTPAPPDISTSFGNFNQMANLSVQQGLAHRFPHVDASKAHGVIEVQTPDGPEDMWAAPSDQGGQCFFIDFADDPVGHGERYGFGGCEGSEKIDYGDVWTYAHPDLKTVYGSVGVDAATLRVTFDDGSTATIPVVEHLFLGSTARDVKVAAVTALDAAGNQLAEKTLRPSAPTHG